MDLKKFKVWLRLNDIQLGKNREIDLGNFKENYEENLEKYKCGHGEICADIKMILEYPKAKEFIDGVDCEKIEMYGILLKQTNSKFLSGNLSSLITSAKAYSAYYLTTEKNAERTDYLVESINRIVDFVWFVYQTHINYETKDWVEIVDDEVVFAERIDANKFKHVDDKFYSLKLFNLNKKVVSELVEICNAMINGDESVVSKIYKKLCDRNLYILNCDKNKELGL